MSDDLEDRRWTAGSSTDLRGLVNGPDLSDVRRRANKLRRSRLALRAIACVALGGAVIATGSVAGGSPATRDTVVADGVPRPDPDSQLIGPYRMPPCSEVESNLENEPKFSNAIAASGEIKETGIARFDRSYTGLRMCSSPALIVLFRKPDDVLDSAATGVARKYNVPLRMVESAVSYAELGNVVGEVRKREAALVARGAPLAMISQRPEGYLIVSVEGDLEAAREVLAGLPYIQVKYGKAGRTL